MQACNDFYTRIPHDFGFRVPPVIRTHEVGRSFVQLVAPKEFYRMFEFIPFLQLCTDRVSDPDPDRIRIQSGQWIRIRIQEGKNYPQK
jgi:hypothetical protein